MSNEEIYSMLEELNIPVAYRQFSKPMKPPFICYLEVYTRNFKADSISYHKVRHIQIELYSKTKDAQIESKIEQVLAKNSIPWDSTESYVDDEHLYQIIYDIEV